jgi:hypothetical protein
VRQFSRTKVVTKALAASLFGATAWAATLASISNPFSPRTAHPYRHGAVVTLSAHAQSMDWLASTVVTFALPPTITHEKMLSYGGGIDGVGVTSGAPRVYLVVYGSQWGKEATDGGGIHTYSGDTANEVVLLQKFFRDLGTNQEAWSGTMTQYCDGDSVAAGVASCPLGAHHVKYPDGKVFAGIWYDSAAKSPVIASAHDLASEAVKAADHFGNKSAAANRYVLYFILSPPGTHPDRFNTGSPDATFCAWHDYSSDAKLDGGPVASNFGGVAFTNMPYVVDAGQNCGANFLNKDATGALDGVTINAGHEYAETITDEFPNGGWTNQSSIPLLGGEENADECTWISPGEEGGVGSVQMSNGSYTLQSSWSNDTNKCELRHVTVQ